jgi:hypothetical protein
VSITVVNTAPTVTITNPLQGAFIPKGKQLDFTAAATDIQDGNLGSKIQWTDNGVSMGTGATLSRNISTVGTHVIAAKVTDNGGMQKTAQITITVTATR